MLFRLGGVILPSSYTSFSFYETAVGALILIAAVTAVSTCSRMGSILALGVVGYGVALFFIFYSAPDLAITQILVETLMVILFTLVIYHLPRFQQLSCSMVRWEDICIALAGGSIFGLLVLKAVEIQLHPTIAEYFLNNSLTLGHGRNVVNVILVDFRAMDTLGEIVVLTIASLGVYALLKFPKSRTGSGENR